MYSGDEFLLAMVPNDHSRQISTIYLLDKVLAQRKVRDVLDLGCGTGESIDYFKKKDPAIGWTGLDIGSSAEVSQRSRKGPEFFTYDGEKIPFADGSFDLVYCNQTYEHVRKPFALIKEVDRVLRPGGCFVGSVSYLEPFHSLSVCNFTPYGFNALLSETSLVLAEIRPGIDVLTVLTHRLTGRFPMLGRIIDPFFAKRESPVNLLISVVGGVCGKSHQDINLLKLLFSGQFRFLAKKGL